MVRFRPIMQEIVSCVIDIGVLPGCGTGDVYISVCLGESTNLEMQLTALGSVAQLKIIKACTPDSAKFLKCETSWVAANPTYERRH